MTHIEPGDDGAPAFVVAAEEDIISAVLEKLVARSIAQALENETDEE